QMTRHYHCRRSRNISTAGTPLRRKSRNLSNRRPACSPSTMIVRAGALCTASGASEWRTSGSAPLPVPGADVASDTAHSVQCVPTGMTSVFESGLHASHGGERLRDPDVRHEVHEALGDRFLAHFGGLDRGADVTGKLRFGAAHCRHGGPGEHLAVAELEPVTLVRAAEHCAGH